MKDDYIEGASASLNKTISELMEYMEDDSARPSADLRRHLREKIAEVAEWWLWEGFYLGHRESWRAQRDGGEIPPTLSYRYRSAHLAPEVSRTVELESQIRRRERSAA